MTTEQRIDYFKGVGIEFMTEMPEGWAEIPGATTAPIGYVWICNRQSIFSKAYCHALLKVKQVY